MNNDYDVIIIGAGIGGLVCGCYLSKAGLKVLLIERNSKVGGYCVSFKRKFFQFDAAVHSFGSCRQEGQIGALLTELKLDKEIIFNQSDPAFSVVTPQHRVTFGKNVNFTIQQLQKQFPNEASQIESFFKFLLTAGNFHQLRNIDFRSLLDSYFFDRALKAILATPLFDLGSFPFSISSLTAIVHYREFVFDGGYYPEHGTQYFSNKLLEKFIKSNGEILLSNSVDKLLIDSDKVTGVRLTNGSEYRSKITVSACDARQTFLQFLEPKHLNNSLVSKLKKLKTSNSSFVLYLGIKSNILKSIEYRNSFWYLPSYDIEQSCREMLKKKGNESKRVIFCAIPNFNSNSSRDYEEIVIYTLAHFRTKKFWILNKDFLKESICKTIKHLAPGLLEGVLLTETATPQTFYKYTLNSHGASAGWASIPSQIAINISPQNSYLKGLYLTGQWCTSGFGQGGISTTVYSAKKLSNHIINNIFLKK